MDLIEKFNEEVVKKENKELTKKLKFDTAEWIYKLNEDVDLYKLLVNFTTYNEKELEEFEYSQITKKNEEVEEEEEEEEEGEKRNNNNKKMKLIKISKDALLVEDLGFDSNKFIGQLLFLSYTYSTFSQNDVDLYPNIKNSNSLVWYYYFFESSLKFKNPNFIENKNRKTFLSELCYLYLIRLDCEMEKEIFNLFLNTFKPMLEKLKASNLFTVQHSNSLVKRNEVTNLLRTVFCNMFKTRVDDSLKNNVLSYKEEIDIIISALPLIVTNPSFIFHRIVDKFFLTVGRAHQSIRSNNIVGAFFLLHFFTSTQIYLVVEDLNKYFEF